jgi:peptide chain release factor 2
MTSPTFWDDKEEAQVVVAELSACRRVLDPFNKLESQATDFRALAELLQEEGINSELVEEAEESWPRLDKDLSALEMVSFLSGKFDRNNAILTLHPGSGGTESCDWASMLFRMYMRWIERRGFKSQVVDYQPGDVAGIKSSTIIVTGEYAYGYLQGESGVHRLVRISPFDSNKRRHTSFAAAEVVPEIHDEVEIEIDEKDLRVDTFRSSGAGGQHVNTTDSAVRLTHIPTGVVVSCQAERSQHQNRATAMRVLRSKLHERHLAKFEQEKQEIVGLKEENAWGSQIRSYVLHPYQMVTDLRTNEETSDTAAVLDGDLNNFIEAYLKTNRNER